MTTRTRVSLITSAIFLAGLMLGMVLHPVKFDATLKSLQGENRLLREMYDLRTEELQKINEILSQK